MEIHVQRLEARYHLPPSRRDQQARLDRLLPEVFETALELAFEHHGVATDGELVIRELAVPVTLRLGAGDGGLMVAWADAVAKSVAGALAVQDDRRVVAYANRRRALTDFAREVARGGRDRLWAFERLGFLTAGAEDRAELELARALVAAPEALVAVLAELGQEGYLPSLVARFEAPWWPELAARALVALGLGEAIGWLGEDAPSPRLPAARLHRALRRSPLAAAAHQAMGPARRALLVLALAAEDRGLLLDAAEQTEGAAIDGDDLPASLAATANEDRPAESVLAPNDASAASFRPDPSPARPPSPFVSDFGGLLFLLPLVDIAALPSARPLRFSLHQLALHVVPADSSDPAVLAFAGLGPEALSPALGEPALTEAEAVTMVAEAERLSQALAALLGEPEAPAAVLARVVRRRAVFVADPGWIEVRLSLDDVSTDVRRAGLDLDPGFLPWLGVVVRFVYE